MAALLFVYQLVVFPLLWLIVPSHLVQFNNDDIMNLNRLGKANYLARQAFNSRSQH